MKELRNKLGEMEYDGLVAGLNPPVRVDGGTIGKLTEAAVLKRGTLLGKAEDTGLLSLYGGTGTPLAPVKAVKQEMHGLKYSVELTLPPLSAVFYEHKLVRGAKDSAGGDAPKAKAEKAPKAAKAKKPSQAVKAAEEQPAEAPKRKPRAKRAGAAQADEPKAVRKPRAKKDAAQEEKPKTRKPRAKKTEN